MTQEIVKIVDSSNKEIASAPRNLMRQDNLLHQSANILVFDSSDRLFIQKRTTTKDVFPGCYEVGAGGVVLSGESYEHAAHRELEEELGIKTEKVDFMFNHYYEDEHTRVFIRVFSCIHDGPFILQKEEVESGTFLSLDEIKEMLSKTPFTPDSVEILQKFHSRQNNTIYFLHGLDSSGKGTKGRYFSKQFPRICSPDFMGSLDERMAQLTTLLEKQSNITLIGSSFGGLMATCYAERYPEKLKKLILLAPALNFEQYTPSTAPCTTPAHIIIGKNDTVCPPDVVLPLARQVFSNLKISEVDDDHMLHRYFPLIHWEEELYGS